MREDNALGATSCRKKMNIASSTSLSWTFERATSRASGSNVVLAAAVRRSSSGSLMKPQLFDSGGAMLSVRKGKRMIQFTYPSCACTTKDIVPLARKVVSGL